MSNNWILLILVGLSVPLVVVAVVWHLRQRGVPNFVLWIAAVLFSIIGVIVYLFFMGPAIGNVMEEMRVKDLQEKGAGPSRVIYDTKTLSRGNEFSFSTGAITTGGGNLSFDGYYIHNCGCFLASLGPVELQSVTEAPKYSESVLNRTYWRNYGEWPVTVGETYAVALNGGKVFAKFRIIDVSTGEQAKLTIAYAFQVNGSRFFESPPTPSPGGTGDNRTGK